MAQNTVSKTFKVPTNMVGKLAKDSNAYECFVNRQFSARLQAYMATYVVSMTSFYSMYSGFTDSK